MEVSPKLVVTRFAQLDAGDLFMYRLRGDACVGMVVEDPTANGERLQLPLGPTFPQGITGPTVLIAEAVTVVSFGKDFHLRLPVHPGGWVDAEPPSDRHCVVVGSTGIYLRANRSPIQFGGDKFRPCYIDMATGLINITGSGAFGEFAVPSGAKAYAPILRRRRRSTRQHDGMA